MYPKVSQKIVVEVIGEGVVCHSIVADVGHSEILIGHPLDGDTVGLFPDGAQIAVSFISGDNKYRFKANIIGRKNDKILLYRITKPPEKDIVKIQMRENFRVETLVKVKLADIELHTINISAGGLLFSCTLDLPFNVGEEVSGTLFITDDEPISFKGVIKRVQVVEEMIKHVAMQFTVLDRKDEAKIVQFCFQKQRQKRMIER